MADRKYRAVELGPHTVADPQCGFGKPTFKGTRKSVENVIRCFQEGHNLNEVAALWGLSREAVFEALELAATAIREFYRVPAPQLEAPPEETSQAIAA